jgi:hypothetical protein
VVVSPSFSQLNATPNGNASMTSNSRTLRRNFRDYWLYRFTDLLRTT